MLLYFNKRLLAIVRGQKVILLFLQFLAEHVYIGGFVINNQNGCLRSHVLTPNILKKTNNPAEIIRAAHSLIKIACYLRHQFIFVNRLGQIIVGSR